MANIAYMILPRLNDAQRALLRDGQTASTTLRTGSLIYNTDDNKIQVYTGSGWETVSSS